MGVVFLDLKRQYQTLREEISRAVGEVLESQHFILGPEVERLESERSEERRVGKECRL